MSWGMQRVDPSWDPYHEKRITLGGLVDHYRTIKRGRRVMFVACGTSFHACLACRQTMEELAELPVRPEMLWQLSLLCCCSPPVPLRFYAEARKMKCPQSTSDHLGSLGCPLEIGFLWWRFAMS